MAFLTPRKLGYWPFLALPLLLFLAYSHYYINEELLFSALLDSSFISFADFDLEYTKALNLSVSQRTPFQYVHPPSSTAQIPRIIHHIWFTAISRDGSPQTEIPLLWSDTQTMCQDNNPNFTFYTWSAETGHDFIQQNYPWFIPTYDAYPFPIQRVDALKYFLLWHYGGVYIDLDISCRRPLDPLLEFSAWFPRATPLGVNNDLMASRPGHPVFGRMIRSLQVYNCHYYFTYPTVFWSTGPMFVNTVLKDYWFRNGDEQTGKSALEEAMSRNTINDHTNPEKNSPANRYAGPGDIAVLPQIFYSEEYTFFGHRPGGSWHGDDVFVVVWVWERLWGVLGTALVFVAVMFGLRRMRMRRMKRVAYEKLSFA
jgi:mannosyltransferase OCH1-like enzyme